MGFCLWNVFKRMEYQAEVVRMAFYMAAMCHTYAEIRDEMNRMEREEGSESLNGKKDVRRIAYYGAARCGHAEL